MRRTLFTIIITWLTLVVLLFAVFGGVVALADTTTVEEAYNIYNPSDGPYDLDNTTDELCAVNNNVDFEVGYVGNDQVFTICTPDGFTADPCCGGATYDDTASFSFDADDDGGPGGYDFRVMYEPGSAYYPAWSATDPWAYSDFVGYWQLSEVEGVSAEKVGNCLIVTISADMLGATYGHAIGLNDHTGLYGCDGGPDMLLVTPGEIDGVSVGGTGGTPAHDLVVGSLNYDWVNEEQTLYNVSFSIRNNGDQPAGASTAALVINEAHHSNYAIGALNPDDESGIITVGPLATTEDGDFATVCADSENVVEESNEQNNCSTRSIGGGCFIATASSGDPDNDGSVQTLRDFRDNCLLNNSVGSGFVNSYYTFSPPVAGFIAENPALKPAVRLGLLPAVALSNTAVSMNLAGKLAVLTALAMIAGIPAVILFRRKARRSRC